MRGMGNMQGLMKQAQKMQKEMTKAQEALQTTEFEARANEDLVVVKMTGNRRLTALEIKQEVVDPEDIDMLQDLVLATVNNVLEQIDAETERTMGKYTRGLNLPF